MPDDLKPCPFCGTVPHTEANNAVPGGRIVVHDGPDECPLDGGYYRVERWNNRPSDEVAQIVAWLRANKKGGVDPWQSAADAIERGDHKVARDV